MNKRMKRGALTCFLSYNNKDKKFVHKLALDLQSQGISVWIDDWAIKGGQSISDSVQKALTQYDVFIIVLSPNSVKSMWVKEELRVAFKRRLSRSRSALILPVLFKKCRIPTFLADYKYISFLNRQGYKSSFTQLCDSIIFRKELLGKYQVTYSGGFIVDSILVTTRISGKGQDTAKFQELYSITPTQPVSAINKEINTDGSIVNASLSNGKIIRKAIGKNTERWQLVPSATLPLGKKVDFQVVYELSHEFDFSKRWYYTIDAPTRSFTFKFVFTKECIPKRFRVTFMQTQTTIFQRTLKGKGTSSGKEFLYHVDFPSFKDRFEFTWD